MRIMRTDFFLGANSPKGFCGLYDELEQIADTEDLMILTGGPGVGKSTMMKAFGREAEELGLRVEYIHCSGDPASLDAVMLPELGITAADGTAPHILTPRYPIAVDRLVDLGRFYDVDRLKERRAEILACTANYRSEYAQAYECLRARRAVLAELEEGIIRGADRERLRRRLCNVWEHRKGKKRGRTGREHRRFLGGMTPAGRVWCTDTIDTLCNCVYALQDPYHLGTPILEELKERIVQDGWDVIVCYDPDVPERIVHLLVPEEKLGFVTEDRAFSLPRKAERRIHTERLLQQELLRASCGALRLKERLAEALEEEGAEHLRLAGEKHGELERIYRPFVDFDGVNEVTEQELQRLRRVAAQRQA